MTSRVLKIGIVGANAERGWARDAHLAALTALPQFSIAAISARSQVLADAAAPVFGNPRAFGDSLQMVRDPEIDVVAVTVKVPEHHAVVMAALAAGKHVYCEWPLGRDLAEAMEMAGAVRPDAHVMVGLQGLSAPAILQAGRLVAAGAIGAVRILRVQGSAAAWGGDIVPAYNAYLQDRASGATLESIGGGHALAAVEALVGPYRAVDARNTTLRPNYRVEGSDVVHVRTSADHMVVLGEHEGGCISIFEMIGAGRRRALFEIEGEVGTLRVVGSVPGTYQIPPLELEGDFPVEVEETQAPDLTGPAVNVARAWARFSSDIESGRRTVPDFDDAVRLTRLLDAIDAAARSGRRQILD